MGLKTDTSCPGLSRAGTRISLYSQPVARSCLAAAASVDIADRRLSRGRWREAHSAFSVPGRCVIGGAKFRPGKLSTVGREGLADPLPKSSSLLLPVAGEISLRSISDGP